MNFSFYNFNPFGKKTGDCVVRAICGATNKSWEDVYDDLCTIGRDMREMPNQPAVYQKYLHKIGWKKQKMPRQQKGWKILANRSKVPYMGRYTVEEFARENPKGLFIISVANHLTYIENGILVDTWDCSHKSLGNFWIL